MTITVITMIRQMMINTIAAEWVYVCIVDDINFHLKRDVSLELFFELNSH